MRAEKHLLYYYYTIIIFWFQCHIVSVALVTREVVRLNPKASLKGKSGS